uniref:anthranilate synthase n=1 Tax=Hirondellea gigas TaxID=1518452 RepID=A0A2R5L1G3_9CRUS
MPSDLTVLIDNYDSFTFNVYQYLCELGCTVKVFRNDKITLDDIKEMDPRRIIISPGPGTPSEAGISKEVILRFAGEIPIFGICLGMQSMFEVYGGKIVQSDEIKHGKTSEIYHNGTDVFKNIKNAFLATRYHSLVGAPETIPDCLEVTAKTKNDIIMGVRHKEFTVSGVQFHPESITTENGKVLLQNFLDVEGGKWKE